MTDGVYRVPSFTYTRTTEGILDRNKTMKGYYCIIKISLILFLILSHS